MRNVSRVRKRDPFYFGYVSEVWEHTLVLSLVETTVDEQSGRFDFMQIIDDRPVLQWSNNCELAWTVAMIESILVAWVRRGELTQCNTPLGLVQYNGYFPSTPLATPPDGTGTACRKRSQRPGTLSPPKFLHFHASL